MGAPNFTQSQTQHRIFDANKQRQKVCGAAVRCRAVFGTCLAKYRHVAGNGEIAGHPDLLSARDAHAVDPTDHRFVAMQNRRHHIVKQTHVLTVLFRLTRVIFGVFPGVAACAKGLIAFPCEHHGHHVPGICGGSKRQNNLFYHLGSI